MKQIIVMVAALTLGIAIFQLIAGPQEGSMHTAAKRVWEKEIEHRSSIRKGSNMKNLIIMAAVLPFLLVFMMQFALDQKNSSAIARFQASVYTAKEEAKQAGCFTQDIKDKLKTQVAKDLDIKENEVEIEATGNIQYRVNYFSPPQGGQNARGMIYYKVSVPLGKLVAGGPFFGIKEAANQGKYVIESHTASERLPLGGD